MSIEAKQVYQAFNFITKLGAELEALADAIENAITLEMKNLEGWPTIESFQRDSRMDDFEWVHTDYGGTITLKKRANSRNLNDIVSIFYQMSLCGDGVDPEFGEPMLHIASWGEDELDFGNGYYLSFPYSAQNYEYEDKPAPEFLAYNKVTFESNEIWHKSMWAYSLKLMQIQDTSDVKNYIAQPILKILQAGSKENLEQVFDGLNDEKFYHFKPEKWLE